MKSTCLLVLCVLLFSNAHAESLREELDAAKAKFGEIAPAERRAMYEDGIDAVAASGIYGEAMKVGDVAPDFTLTNTTGESVTLSTLLEAGPVVLTWYRGGWCPYCNIALAAMQRHLPQIHRRGAQLVALTPELPDHTLTTKEKATLQFQVLSDVGNSVARDYGIVFTMTDGVAGAMRERHTTHLRNGDESDELPLAATYVIDRDGTITYAFLDADYRKRAEPSRIIDALDAIEHGMIGQHAVLQFWENTWNPPYDLSLVDRLMSEDFVITSGGQDIEGREAFKAWITAFQSEINDLRMTNREIFASAGGDRIVSRWIVHGRNNGLFDTEPDQRPVRFTGVSVWEWKDGKLTHNWVERSAYALYRELGE